MPTAFDPVSSFYDLARPSYPEGVYDAIESVVGTLAGMVVLDVGAGTGIASRQLLARGARVVAIDASRPMLEYAAGREPHPACVVGDGHVLPIRDGAVDVACFAQAWHWFDVSPAAREVARVLVPDGLWTAWWSQPRADGIRWFDEYQDVMEGACAAYDRRHRDVGRRAWSDEPISATGMFTPVRQVEVPWTRELATTTWLDDERSKSYIEDAPPDVRRSLLAEIERIIGSAFPTGSMSVPYLTHMWIARRS